MEVQYYSNGGKFLPEIWFKIFKLLTFNELKSCRLISSKFKEISTSIIRETHRQIVFGTSSRLQEFLRLIDSGSGEFPFSKFEIYHTNVDMPSLREMIEKYGDFILELRFPDPSQLTVRHEQFYCAQAECLTIMLSRVPNLKCLKTMIYDYRMATINKMVFPDNFANLRKLKLRLIYALGTKEGDAIVRELLQKSPVLEKLTIHFANPTLLNMTERFRKLVELLNDLSQQIKVELRHLTLENPGKEDLKKLNASNVQLFKIFVFDHHLADFEELQLFWGWVARQPIRKLWLCKHTSNLTEINLNGIQPFIFEHCQTLRIARLNHPLLENGYFKFPNLSRIEIASATFEFLKWLSISFPKITTLSWDFVEGDSWNVFMQGDAQDALEINLGIMPPPQISRHECSLSKFKALRYLNLGALKVTDLTALLFMSSCGMIPSMDVLTLRSKTIRSQDIMRYENLISLHHQKVIVKEGSGTHKAWWMS